MLLLVTLALVVASAVLLILGFVQDALGYIYLSMLCAGVAAVALFVFARLARRRSTALAGAGIAGAPVAASPYMAGVPVDDRAPVVVTADDGGDDDTDDDRASTRPVPAIPSPLSILDDDQPDVVVVGRGSAPVDDPWAPSDLAEDWGDEVVFPIEDYDDLRVAEILPLLSQLDPDELQEVRDREVAGKARGTIIDRIDDRLGRAGRRDQAPVYEDAPITAREPAVVADEEPAIVADEEDVAEEEIEVEVTPPAPVTTKRATTGTRARKATPAAPEAPAKKAAARATKATGTGQAAAKKAAAKTTAKATPAKAPAKKAAAKKAAKTTATKTAAAKTTATKGAAAKKTAAKKATPTKRAAKKAE